jgi:protein SCO1/2
MMRSLLICAIVWWCTLGISLGDATGASGVRAFPVRGVIEKIELERLEIVIRHEAISNYMAAMTMPFKVKNLQDLAGLERGDQVTFQLHVADESSWVDDFSKIGTVALPQTQTKAIAAASDEKFELLHYQFTNELDQPISLSSFPGQALAITFFFTRCPLPDYCPLLSRNFADASRKLKAMPNAPTNWHFISISIDPENDSPAMLHAYGERYHYDPAHWSFITGPKDKIMAVASRSGVTIEEEHGSINHNFRTLIIDAAGNLQMVFPMNGDLSDMIVDKIVQAASGTNAVTAPNLKH